MSVISYTTCVFVSLNRSPKLVRCKRSLERHSNTSCGMSIWKSPRHGLASFGLVFRRRIILAWIFCRDRATIRLAGTNLCRLENLPPRWLYLVSNTDTASCSSAKNLLILRIPSPVSTLSNRVCNVELVVEGFQQTLNLPPSWILPVINCVPLMQHCLGGLAPPCFRNVCKHQLHLLLLLLHQSHQLLLNHILVWLLLLLTFYLHLELLS